MVITRNKDGSWSAFSRFMGKRFVVDADTIGAVHRTMFLMIKKHYREIEEKKYVVS